MSKTESLHYKLCCEGAKWMRKQEWSSYKIVALREMEKVWDEELKDRLAKGITGDAAVQHYNEWMDKAGMSHLKAK